MLGITTVGLSVSEYASVIHGISTAEMIESGTLPPIDLDLEKQFKRPV